MSVKKLIICNPFRLQNLSKEVERKFNRNNISHYAPCIWLDYIDFNQSLMN